MIRCTLCGREGVARHSFEVMVAAMLEPGHAMIGGELVEVPPGSPVGLYVCKGRAACRRRRGLRL